MDRTDLLPEGLKKDLPTLRTCLTAPPEKIRAASLLPWQTARDLPLPALEEEQRQRLRPLLRPERKEVTQALSRMLKEDPDLAREIGEETRVSHQLLDALVECDGDLARLCDAAAKLADRADAACLVLDGAMAGSNARALQAVLDLAQDPARPAWARDLLRCQFAEPLRLYLRQHRRRQKRRAETRRQREQLQAARGALKARAARRQAEAALLAVAKKTRRPKED